MGAHNARAQYAQGTQQVLTEAAQHGAGIYAVCFSNTHSAEAEKQVALAPTSPLLLHRCISCISAFLLQRLPPLLRPSKATLLRV